MNNKFYLSQDTLKRILKGATSFVRVDEHEKFKSLIGCEVKIREHFYIDSGVVKYVALDGRPDKEKIYHAANMPDNIVRAFITIKNVSQVRLCDISSAIANSCGYKKASNLVLRTRLWHDIDESELVSVVDFTVRYKHGVTNDTTGAGKLPQGRGKGMPC